MNFHSSFKKGAQPGFKDSVAFGNPAPHKLFCHSSHRNPDRMARPNTVHQIAQPEGVSLRAGPQPGHTAVHTEEEEGTVSLPGGADSFTSRDSFSKPILLLDLARCPDSSTKHPLHTRL